MADALSEQGRPDAWNRTRFDPAAVDSKKGHVESYFVQMNDPCAPRALRVKLTIFSPTAKTSGDRKVVFEGFSGRVKAGLFTTPLLTIVGLRHRGVRYEAPLRALPTARGRIENPRRWSFSSRQAGARLEGTFELADDDTVGHYDPNPTGEMTYCLSSKIARASVRFSPPGRSAMRLTSNAAALEIGTHDAAHGIRMYV